MEFKRLPKSEWPSKINDPRRQEVYLSKKYLAQVFDEGDGVTRISINLVKRKGSKWAEGITWQELQDVNYP